MALLTLVASTSAGLFIKTVASSSGLQRRQASIEVAQQQMELVRAVVPMTASGTDGLIAGRYKTAVDAQWATTTSADLSQTNEVWDTLATTASVPVLPLTKTSTVAGEVYTVRTFIGTCYLPAAGGACVKTSTAGASLMARVIVSVTWTPGTSGTCSGAGCEYVLASLINLNSDPVFIRTSDGRRDDDSDGSAALLATVRTHLRNRPSDADDTDARDHGFTLIELLVAMESSACCSPCSWPASRR